MTMRQALLGWLDYAEKVCDEDADEDSIQEEFQEAVRRTSEALGSRTVAEFVGQTEQSGNNAGKVLGSWGEMRELADHYRFHSDEKGFLAAHLEKALDEIERIVRKR